MSKTGWFIAAAIAGLICGCSTTKQPAKTAAVQGEHHDMPPTGNNTTHIDQTGLQKTNDVLLATFYRWLKLNDEIVEKKQQLIKGFQEHFEPYKANLFQAAGGSGQLVDFNVADVFFYKGCMVVETQYFWLNSDHSGGFGVGYVALNQDKDFEIVNCSLDRQVMISADEVAAIERGNKQPVHQIAAETVPKSSDFSMSEDTKQFLIKAGIGVGAALIQSWLQSE